MLKIITAIFVVAIVICSCNFSSRYPGTYTASDCTSISGMHLACPLTLTLDDKSHFLLKSGEHEIKGQWEVYDDAGKTILNLKREDKYENIELNVKMMDGKNTFTCTKPSQLLLPDSIPVIVLK